MNDIPSTSSVQPFKSMGDDDAAAKTPELDESDPVGSALAKAAEQFHGYAKDHTRKAEAFRHKAGFEQDAGIRDSRIEDAMESERKAKINADMASIMEEALLTHTAKLDA